MSHWIHIKIHQDTCILDSSSRYIKIHRDTKTNTSCILDASWRYNQDRTHAGYVRDTWRIHAGYMKDTCRIHARYMRVTCIWRGSRIHSGYMQDTLKINQRYMRDNVSGRVIKIHSGYIRDTWWDTCISSCILRGTYPRCRIHAGYMRDTCICKGNQDTFGIHPRYIMRYMYLKFIQTDMYLIWRRHAGYMQDTCGIHEGYMYPQG